MTAAATPRRRSVTPVLKEEARVTPLELFFDLVFVLALTQCTAFMAADPSWEGLAKGLLILGVLWWSWVGYAWLTSVIDPEEGAVRLVVFVAMAAFLIASLAVPEAFDDSAAVFAGAYAVVRVAHIALFMIASADDPALRRSVVGLATSTAIGTGLLVAASFADGTLQGSLWAIALLCDAGGPFLFGAEGWKLVPGHFAERHGLILLIALGESIVAIGIGAEKGIDTGIVVAAVLGIVVAAAMWWAYFDVGAIVGEYRLAHAPEGRVRNELARDSYSYLHFLMVAGIVLGALGLKKTLGHTGDPLKLVPAVALCGGPALYMLGLVGFRLRSSGTLAKRRVLTAVALLALIPLATEVAASLTLGLAAAVLVALITFETFRYSKSRDEIRHRLAEGHVPE